MRNNVVVKLLKYGTILESKEKRNILAAGFRTDSVTKILGGGEEK